MRNFQVTYKGKHRIKYNFSKETPNAEKGLDRCPANYNRVQMRDKNNTPTKFQSLQMNKL